MVDNSRVQESFYTLGNIAAKAEVPIPIVENAFLHFWEFCESINSVPPKTFPMYGKQVNLAAFCFLVSSAWEDGFLFSQEGETLVSFLARSDIREVIVSGKVRAWARKQLEPVNSRKLETLIDSAASTMLNIIFGSDSRVPVHVVEIVREFDQKVYGGRKTEFWKENRVKRFVIIRASNGRMIPVLWNSAFEQCIGKTVILTPSDWNSEDGRQFYKLASAGRNKQGFSNVVFAARGMAANHPTDSDMGQRSTRRWSSVIPDGEFRDMERERVDILDFIDEARGKCLTDREWYALECMRVSGCNASSAAAYYNSQMKANVTDRSFRRIVENARTKMKTWQDSLDLD